MADTGGNVVGGLHTAGEGKERLLKILFMLSCVFGGLHFVGISGQVVTMYLHTALNIDINFPLKSSMLMGNIYIGFLTAYVGRKEMQRRFSGGDEQQLPRYVWLKLTRGEVIIVAWAMLTAVTVFLWGSGYIAEVPNILIFTMGEVLALWVGGDIVKYFRTQSADVKRETESNAANYADRVEDYCRAHGSIDRLECQTEFGLSEDQAYRLLKRMVKDKKLIEYGDNKGRRYKLP